MRGRDNGMSISPASELHTAYLQRCLGRCQVVARGYLVEKGFRLSISSPFPFRGYSISCLYLYILCVKECTCDVYALCACACACMHIFVEARCSVSL